MRGRARLAVAAPILSIGLLVGSLVLAVVERDALTRQAGGLVPILGFVGVIVAFSSVGALLTVRRPDNPVGWMLAIVGLLFAVVVATSTVSVWGIDAGTMPRAAAEWLSVPGNLWVVALSLIAIHVPLRLPDGHLPSPRWRWFSRATIPVIAIALVGMAVQPGQIDNLDGTANPLGSDALAPLSAAFGLVILAFVGGLAGLVLRYRRSTGHERAQLRWIALGGVVFLVVFLVTLYLPVQLGLDDDAATTNAIQGVGQLAFAALPVAIGYAILKHRLYDIDVVVRRTLVYGALTATLAATYLVTVLVLQLALSAVTSDSGLAVAGSTLAVAALFRPARARIQAAVDRRFYRRRYDARTTLDAFSARLRDEVDLDAVTTELDAVVRHTFQPAHVSVWLRRADG